MHLTVHRPEDPGEQPEQRGLTGTVAPPYDDDLTGLDSDGHAPQHPDPASAVPEANLVQAHGAYHAIRHRRREPGDFRGFPAPVTAGGYASAVASVKLRVTLGSTGMPGPIVVVRKTFLRYLPLAADGLERSTSSSTAA